MKAILAAVAVFLFGCVYAPEATVEAPAEFEKVEYLIYESPCAKGFKFYRVVYPGAAPIKIKRACHMV